MTIEITRKSMINCDISNLTTVNIDPVMCLTQIDEMLSCDSRLVAESDMTFLRQFSVTQTSRQTTKKKLIRLQNTTNLVLAAPISETDTTVTFTASSMHNLSPKRIFIVNEEQFIVKTVDYDNNTVEVYTRGADKGSEVSAHDVTDKVVATNFALEVCERTGCGGATKSFDVAELQSQIIRTCYQYCSEEILEKLEDGILGYDSTEDYHNSMWEEEKLKQLRELNRGLIYGIEKKGLVTGGLRNAIINGVTTLGGAVVKGLVYDVALDNKCIAAGGKKILLWNVFKDFLAKMRSENRSPTHMLISKNVETYLINMIMDMNKDRTIIQLGEDTEKITTAGGTEVTVKKYLNNPYGGKIFFVVDNDVYKDDEIIFYKNQNLELIPVGLNSNGIFTENKDDVACVGKEGIVETVRKGRLINDVTKDLCDSGMIKGFDITIECDTCYDECGECESEATA